MKSPLGKVFAPSSPFYFESTAILPSHIHLDIIHLV